MGTTLLDQLWDSHVVRRGRHGDPDLLYVDLHLLHEVTSPQAFAGLRAAGRVVRRPDLTFATEDHNVPTDVADADLASFADPLSRIQVATLRRNCADSGIPIRPLGHADQGIVHVVGPELGLTQPGMTIVCGDSHTSTHGAFGALAFGIGTSEVEHVLATQTLVMQRPKTMSVRLDGVAAEDVDAKDIALALIAIVGTGGGQGHLVEYRGDAVSALSMEERMTLCNMTVEWGARAGVIAPDARTIAHVRGRDFAPTGPDWDAATEVWRGLRSDADAVFDASLTMDVTHVRPRVTWGTDPSQNVELDGAVPDQATFADPQRRAAAEAALAYIGLTPGTRMTDVEVDTVFVGSCTNGRIEDLRSAAAVLRGRTVAAGVRMLVVPGSARVRAQAEADGLHEVFLAAGAQWRRPGCSMCVGMNPDRVAPGRRSASTTNRNFEGRQGPGARTHLVSPAVAAATAVTGRLAAPPDV